MSDARVLRVALVAGTLARGGAETQAAYMAEALAARGITVHVFALRGGALAARLARAGVPVLHVGAREAPPARLLALIVGLARFRPHVVQATHFFVNLYAAAGARAVAARSVGAIRNSLAYEFAATGAWARMLLRAPDALIANSEAARGDAIAAGLPRERVHFVPNAIAPVRPHGAPGGAAPPGDGLLVLTVARLVPAKGVDRVLHAVALARAVEPELRLAIVGDGPERARLEALARGPLALDPAHACFLGPRDDVPALLAAADLFVLASEHEGTPNALLEAMQAGVPVVTTAAGDAATLVGAGGAGVVVERGDVPGLAEAIVRVARTPAARVAFGDAGRRVAARHAPDQLGARLLEVYRRCAEQRRDRRLLRLC